MKRFVHHVNGSFLLLGPLSTAQAQQTIFNISSSDITPEGKILVQEQIEMQDLFRSTTTLSYGLSKDWEVGLNLYNLDFTKPRPHFIRNDSTTAMPYAPLLGNAQKAIPLSEVFKIDLGGQGGLNLTPAGHTRAAHFAYANLAISLRRSPQAGGRGLPGQRPLSQRRPARWRSGGHRRGSLVPQTAPAGRLAVGIPRAGAVLWLRSS